MAIMRVNCIPEVEHKVSEPKGIKERVLIDIEEAYAEGIVTFEFVGYYDSSPEYVGTCAREMAFKFLNERFVNQAVHNAKKKAIRKYKKKIGDAAELIRIQRPMLSAPAITVTGITIGGAKRVFCKIDYDYINQLEKTLFDVADKKYSDPKAQEELKEKAERIAFRKEMDAYRKQEASK